MYWRRPRKIHEEEYPKIDYEELIIDADA